MLKFDTSAYMPLVSYESATLVTLNNLPTTFKHIESQDKGVISAVYINIPTELNSSSLKVTITGLKNPNYVSDTNT